MNEDTAGRATSSGDPSVAAALARAVSIKGAGCTVVTIRSLCQQEIQEALASPGVSSLVVADPPGSSGSSGPGRVGQIWPERNAWQLPAVCARSIIFAARRHRFGLPMLFQAARCGVRTIHWWSPFGWESASLLQLLMQQARLRTGEWVAQRCFGGRMSGDRVGCAHETLTATVTRPASRLRCALEDRWLGKGARQLCLRGAGGLLPAQAFVPHRVLLVTGSLGAGGAERQCVNTLLGLKSRGVQDVAIACRFIGRRSETGFFRTVLDDAGIESVELPPADFRNCGLDVSAVPRLQKDLSWECLAS